MRSQQQFAVLPRLLRPIMPRFGAFLIFASECIPAKQRTGRGCLGKLTSQFFKIFFFAPPGFRVYFWLESEESQVPVHKLELSDNLLLDWF